jgi:hypothetical protein
VTTSHCPRRIGCDHIRFTPGHDPGAAANGVSTCSGHSLGVGPWPNSPITTGRGVTTWVSERETASTWSSTPLPLFAGAFVGGQGPTQDLPHPRRAPRVRRRAGGRDPHTAPIEKGVKCTICAADDLLSHQPICNIRARRCVSCGSLGRLLGGTQHSGRVASAGSHGDAQIPIEAQKIPIEHRWGFKMKGQRNQPFPRSIGPRSRLNRRDFAKVPAFFPR